MMDLCQALSSNGNSGDISTMDTSAIVISEVNFCPMPNNTSSSSFIPSEISSSSAIRPHTTLKPPRKLSKKATTSKRRCHGWDNMYEHLVTYYKQHGNTMVPRSYEIQLGGSTSSEPTVKLGRWVDKQRQRKKFLSEERTNKLNDVGFVWSFQVPWEDMFARLVKFKEIYGHCLVPQKYTADPKLGVWVMNQRTIKKQRGDLIGTRVEKLNALGFIWCPPKIRSSQQLNAIAAPSDNASLVGNNIANSTLKPAGLSFKLQDEGKHDARLSSAKFITDESDKKNALVKTLEQAQQTIGSINKKTGCLEGSSDEEDDCEEEGNRKYENENEVDDNIIFYHYQHQQGQQQQQPLSVSTTPANTAAATSVAAADTTPYFNMNLLGSLATQSTLPSVALPAASTSSTASIVPSISTIISRNDAAASAAEFIATMSNTTPNTAAPPSSVSALTPAPASISTIKAVDTNDGNKNKTNNDLINDLAILNHHQQQQGAAANVNNNYQAIAGAPVLDLNLLSSLAQASNQITAASAAGAAGINPFAAMLTSTFGVPNNATTTPVAFTAPTHQPMIPTASAATTAQLAGLNASTIINNGTTGVQLPIAAAPTSLVNNYHSAAASAAAEVSGYHHQQPTNAAAASYEAMMTSALGNSAGINSGSMQTRCSDDFDDDLISRILCSNNRDNDADDLNVEDFLARMNQSR